MSFVMVFLEGLCSFPSEKCPASWNAAPQAPPALREEGKAAGLLLSKTGKIFTSFSPCSVLQETICFVVGDGAVSEGKRLTCSVDRGHRHFACWCRFCPNWLSSGVCGLIRLGFQHHVPHVICSGGLCVFRHGECCPEVFSVLQGKRDCS